MRDTARRWVAMAFSMVHVVAMAEGPTPSPAQNQRDTERDAQAWWVCVLDAPSCAGTTCSRAPS